MTKYKKIFFTTSESFIDHWFGFLSFLTTSRGTKIADWIPKTIKLYTNALKKLFHWQHTMSLFYEYCILNNTIRWTLKSFWLLCVAQTFTILTFYWKLWWKNLLILFLQRKIEVTRSYQRRRKGPIHCLCGRNVYPWWKVSYVWESLHSCVIAFTGEFIALSSMFGVCQT